MPVRAKRFCTLPANRHRKVTSYTYMKGKDENSDIFRNACVLLKYANKVLRLYVCCMSMTTCSHEEWQTNANNQQIECATRMYRAISYCLPYELRFSKIVCFPHSMFLVYAAYFLHHLQLNRQGLDFKVAMEEKTHLIYISMAGCSAERNLIIILGSDESRFLLHALGSVLFLCGAIKKNDGPNIFRTMWLIIVLTLIQRIECEHG